MHDVAVVTGLVGSDRALLVDHCDFDIHRVLQTASHCESDDAGADHPDSCFGHTVRLSYVDLTWPSWPIFATGTGISEPPELNFDTVDLMQRSTP